MKNFGLYKGTTLFYTNGGTFASDAWIASNGQNIGNVSGTSFLAITADDGKEYNIGVHNVSPISEDQFEDLFAKAHPALRLIYKFDQMKPRSIVAKMNYTMYRSNVANLMEQGYTEKEIEEYFIENLF